MATPPSDTKIHVRPLSERDLPEADHIVRLAFGTFIGLPDPSQFMGDADYVRRRWKFDPSSGVAAEHEGKRIGTNCATNWGSFDFFGPLTVDPPYWDRGVAKQLLTVTSTRSGDGNLSPLGQSPPRPVHVFAKPQTQDALPEVRLLVARSGRHHGEAGCFVDK